MAEMQVADSGGGKGGKKRSKKMSTRVDLTPMVDLGFLLITFFMYTTSLSKPVTMEVNMPVKEDKKDEKPPEIKASKVITLLLTKEDKIVYYEGLPDGKELKPSITDYSEEGLHKVLLEKRAKVDAEHGLDSINRTQTIVLIKPNDDSNYKNFVDILDEMPLAKIERYAILDIMDIDKEIMKVALEGNTATEGKKEGDK